MIHLILWNSLDPIALVKWIPWIPAAILVHSHVEKMMKRGIINAITPKLKFFGNLNVEAPKGVVVVQLHDTGGKPLFTQWVCGGFIVGSETKYPA